MLRFLSITKPGILFANIITFIAGYFVGLRQESGIFNIWHFIIAILGMSCVIASGCICNNCIDKDIDLLMARTKNRLIATGKIKILHALTLALFCFIIGLSLLFIINILSMLIAIMAFLCYVIVYSLYTKRHKSGIGIIIGALAGAAPPVIGYTSITNSFDFIAILLFFVLFFWQIPHFHAIAIYRLIDYKNANIAVLPLRHSMFYTKLNMLFFALLFIIDCILLGYFSKQHYIYLVAIFIINMYWIYLIFQGFYITINNHIWAKKIFFISIIVICFLSVMLCF